MMNNLAINDLMNILLIIIILIGMIAIVYLLNRIIVLSKVRLNDKKPDVMEDIGLNIFGDLDYKRQKEEYLHDYTVNDSEYDSETTVMLSMNTGIGRSLARLVFLEDNGKPTGRTEFLIKKTTVLGRGEDVDIKIYDRAVSKHHVKIIYEEDKLWIEDLNSSNGTYLNNVRVQSKTPVSDGGVVKVGRTSFSVQIS